MRRGELHNDRPHRRIDLADAVLRELDHSTSAPDLTGRIMGRLGYMRIAPAVARRRRRRRWAWRTLTGLAFATMVGIGWQVRSHGPDVRRATGPSIPKALGSDLQEHRQKFGRTIQMIREMAPRRDAPPPNPPADLEPTPLPESIDRSAVGPVGWA